jgi:hypothetical protein
MILGIFNFFQILHFRINKDMYKLAATIMVGGMTME